MQLPELPREVPVLNLMGVEVKRIELPRVFRVPVKPFLIRRIFIHQHSQSIQPKGRYPLAGKEKSAEYFGVGLGLARVPRIKTPPLYGVAAFVAQARGGRRPHVTPPEKKVHKEMNKKERLLAIASAIAATAYRELVERRGHVVEGIEAFPIIVDAEVESIKKTREFKEFAKRIGIYADIERVAESVKHVGSKAKWRGRGRKVRKGPLIVYGEDRSIFEAARNMPGVDVIHAKDVSVIHLAPGGVPGRLTVWTEPAIPIIEERLRYVLNRLEVITL